MKVPKVSCLEFIKRITLFNLLSMSWFCFPSLRDNKDSITTQWPENIKLSYVRKSFNLFALVSHFCTGYCELHIVLIKTNMDSTL